MALRTIGHLGFMQRRDAYICPRCQGGFQHEGLPHRAFANRLLSPALFSPYTVEKDVDLCDPVFLCLCPRPGLFATPLSSVPARLQSHHPLSAPPHLTYFDIHFSSLYFPSRQSPHLTTLLKISRVFVAPRNLKVTQSCRRTN